MPSFSIPLANREIIRTDEGWSIAPGVAQTHDSIIEAYVANLAHPPSFQYLLEVFTKDNVTLAHFCNDNHLATRTVVLRITDDHVRWLPDMEETRNTGYGSMERWVQREIRAMAIILGPCAHKDDIYMIMARGVMQLLTHLQEYESEEVTLAPA